MKKTKTRILEDMLISREKIKTESNSLRVENTAEGLQASITCIESNKIEQETREGYNLVNENQLYAFTNIEKIENEIATTVLINNKGISNISFRINEIKIEQGDYYLSCYIRLKSGSCQRINSLQMTGNINQDSLASTEIISSPNISNEFQRYIRKYTFKDTVTENEEVLRFLIQTLNCENAIFEIKNIEISRENKDYEKFGAMPSINFESKVEGVTGDVNLKVRNRNWFDANIVNGSVSASTGVINLQSNIRLTSDKFIEINDLDDFVLSFKTKENKDIQVIIGCYDKEFNYINLLTTSWHRTPYKFKALNNTRFIRTMFFDYNNQNEAVNSDDIYDVQLERQEINVVTGYIKSKAQKFLISLGDKTLYKGDKIVYLNKNNPNATEGAGWYFVSKMFKYIFDGTETWKLTNAQPNNKDWHAFYPSKIANKYSDGVRGEDICFSNYYQNTNNGVMVSATIINDAISNIVLTNPATSGQIMFVSQNSTVEEMKAECKKLYDEGNPLYVVYTLQEPTYKPVTDEKLIKQLDAILLYMSEYDELTNFDFDKDVTFEIEVEKDNLKIINSRLNELEKQNVNTQALSLEMEV